MICPKCNSEVGESKFCPECGNQIIQTRVNKNEEKEILPNRIEADIVNSNDTVINHQHIDANGETYYDALKKIDEEKSKKKKKKRIGCLTVILLIVVFISGFIIISNFSEYNKVSEAIKNGEKYEEAYESYLNSNLFQGKKNAKNSYKWGVLSLKKDLPDFAFKLFDKCIEIDSLTYSDKVEKTKYKYLDSLVKQKKYYTALAIINNLKENNQKVEYDYETMEEWISIAGENYDEKSYYTLIVYLQKEKQEIDPSLYDYCIEFAEEDMKNNDFEKALDLLERYKGEKDIQKEIMECYYQVGLNRFKDKDYYMAEQHFYHLIKDKKYESYNSVNKLYFWIENVHYKYSKDDILGYADSEIKSKLKDPTSYQRISGTAGVSHTITDDKIEYHLSAVVIYSATNSFNARIKDEYLYVKTVEESTHGLKKSEAEKIIEMTSDELMKDMNI